MGNTKITKLCEYIEKTNAKNYPIHNDQLSIEADYIKNYYFKMLAVVLQQGSDIKLMQTMLFTRMISGVKAEYNIEDYMRQALDIEIADFEEFAGQYKENQLKYSFVLDAILLLEVEEHTEEQLNLLVGIMDTFQLKQNQVQYLTLLAKSILLQDTNLYQEAEAKRPDNIDYKLFIHYTVYFVSGILCQTELQLNISSINKSVIEIESLGHREKNKLVFKEKEIVLKNLILDMSDQEIVFTGNESIEIEGCEFIGKKKSIILETCKKVVFRNCIFRKFETRTIIEDGITDVIFDGCRFLECKYKYARSANDWEALGGVIYNPNLRDNGITIINKTEFNDCGGINTNNYFSSAIISNCNVKVEKSKFINCWNYNNGSTIDPNNSGRILFPKKTENKQNEIIGSASFS